MASTTSDHSTGPEPEADEAELPRRRYQRRSEDERIAELESQLAKVKAAKAAKEKRDDPLVREIPKLQRRLLKFAQLAHDERRPQIANMVTAFQAGLERTLRELLDEPARQAHDDEDGDA